MGVDIKAEREYIGLEMNEWSRHNTIKDTRVKLSRNSKNPK